MEKSWNLKTPEQSWDFVKQVDKTTGSQKTCCQTHKTCVSDS